METEGTTTKNRKRGDYWYDRDGCLHIVGLTGTTVYDTSRWHPETRFADLLREPADPPKE